MTMINNTEFPTEVRLNVVTLFMLSETTVSSFQRKTSCHLRLNYKKKQLSSLNTKLKAVLERNGYEMYNINLMMCHSHF